MTTPPLIAALTRQRGPTPVQFTRQAGRSLPKYRELRANVGLPILGVCLHPDMATEVTVQPVRRHGVDADTFFPDIMVPLRLAGVGVETGPGVGPVLGHPYRTRENTDELPSHRHGEGFWTDSTGRARDCAEGVQSVHDGVATAARKLGSTSPIGFGDAPFTLAMYMVEGRPPHDHVAARLFATSDPGAWDALTNQCAWVSADFITAQIEAGASTVQLFDSWVGPPSPRTYRESIAPHLRLVAQRVAGTVSSVTDERAPLIHFGTGNAPILAGMAEVGTNYVGVDWKTDLSWAVTQVPGKAVQGNLDPALLRTPWNVIEQAVRDILDAGRSASGHVFDLGHGVSPTIDPDVLARIMELMHELGGER